MIIKDRIIPETKLKVDGITELDALLTAVFNKYNLTYTYIGVTYVEEVECMMYSFRLGDRTKIMDTYLLTYNILRNDEMCKFGAPYKVTGFSISCMKVSNYEATKMSLWNVFLDEIQEETKKEEKDRKLYEAIQSSNSKIFKPIKTIDVFFNTDLPKYLEECILNYEKNLK